MTAPERDTTHQDILREVRDLHTDLRVGFAELKTKQVTLEANLVEITDSLRRNWEQTSAHSLELARRAGADDAYQRGKAAPLSMPESNAVITIRAEALKLLTVAALSILGLVIMAAGIAGITLPFF